MRRLTLAAFRKWGKQGGKTRSKSLSAKRRKEIAQLAIAARWEKAKKGKKKP
jgi:hypothetical protein